MHNPAMRAVLILLLAIAGATACRTGAAVDAHKAFSDPAVAALAQAAAEGDAARVRALVAQGVDPNAQGDRGVTPLEFAMLAQSVDGMRALLAAGADPNRPGLGGSTAVHLAAMADDPRYLQVLLEHGADPDAPHGETGATPLAAAAGRRTQAQFDLLLAAGADPNRADRMGDTPLHAAALSNNGAQVLQLLEAGADPRARNAQDATFQSYLFATPAGVLSSEARREREAVIAWLREHDIPVETPAAP